MERWNMIIATFIIGILLLVLAYLIGYKKQISLLHSYHYKNVSIKDIPVLCTKVGLGFVFIAIAVFCKALLNGLYPDFYWTNYICMIPLAIGLSICIYYIRKYNGSIFGLKNR